MKKNNQPGTKSPRKSGFVAEMRQKLGLNQELFAILLGVSRALLARAELKKRQLPKPAWALLTEMYLQFTELEQGNQASNSSMASRLILSAAYKAEIPAMKAREKECRIKSKRLLEELQEIKRQETIAKNAIIVQSTLLNRLQEQGIKDAVTNRQISVLKHVTEDAYKRLTGCWAPAQVTLQAKIDSIRAEARVLRRTRLIIMREDDPLKQ